MNSSDDRSTSQQTVMPNPNLIFKIASARLGKEIMWNSFVWETCFIAKPSLPYTLTGLAWERVPKSLAMQCNAEKCVAEETN